ncbi:MAG TPA: glycosyltransferase [Gammaproteobacteria bacterium]|nr:glycosyltransferase [Gammaproteobacteria bacterium]
MKILQVSTTAQQGGAGIAAYRLNIGLRSLGVDSCMLVNKKIQPDEYIISPTNNIDKVMARLYPYLDRVPGCLSRQPLDRISSSWAPNRLISRIKAQSADIVNLHWVNDGFMRIEAFPKIRQPIVWTLHDMWAFSGGEHYVGESIRYKEGYSTNNCPASETGLDVNRWIWKRKKKSWSNVENMVVAAPSKWLADCARQSDLFQNCRVEVLPNGVDHKRFHPVGHATARSILGLPEDKKLILFVEGSWATDKRKGFHLLADALKRLEAEVNPESYQLVVFGKSSGDDSFPMKTLYLGRLHDEISMALVYAAADVFVAPSTEENLANTVLESLSCGTPVVAFDIGGMPDMIAHKKNGYLVPGFDTGAMARGIQWVVEDDQRWKGLSDQARATVVQSYTLQQSASRYMDLYKGLL